MTSAMEHPIDDQALLVLYLAGELTAEQRQRMESRLAESAELTAQLEELRTTHRMLEREFERMDESPSKPDAFAASQRQLSRAIRQWQTDRMRLAATIPTAETRRMRWWMYPAAAALLVIGYIGWWGLQSGPPEVASTLPAPTLPDVAVADATDAGAVTPPAPVVFPSYPTDAPYDLAGMASAERELERLELLRTLMQ